MEPISFYLAFVSTIAVLIVIGFFVKWWYGTYAHLKHRRALYWRNPDLDHSLMMHRVTLFAVCCAATAAILYIWISAQGPL